MNPSPIPPGTLSTGVTASTLIAAALGAFQGHPGWLCLALGIVAAVAISRGWQEAWRAKGTAAVLCMLLLAAPVHADGPQLRAPMPADVPAAPLVPPEAIIPPVCPEPCAACSARVGAALTPAGQPMATWLKAVLGVGVALGGALTVYQQGHAAGTW